MDGGLAAVEQPDSTSTKHSERQMSIRFIFMIHRSFNIMICTIISKKCSDVKRNNHVLPAPTNKDCYGHIIKFVLQFKRKNDEMQ